MLVLLLLLRFVKRCLKFIMQMIEIFDLIGAEAVD